MGINGEVSCYIDGATSKEIELDNHGKIVVDIPEDTLNNISTKLKTIAPDELTQAFVSGDVSLAEPVLTSLVQAEASDIDQTNDSKNPNADAIKELISSLRVVVASSVSYEEFLEYAKNEVLSSVKEALS